MFTFGSSVNILGKNSSGFDSFSFKNRTFILCDGANSCKNGGVLANKLSKSIANKWSDVHKASKQKDEFVFSLIHNEHKYYLSNNFEAASTLVGMKIMSHEFEMISVGDSYGEIFYKDQNLGWKKIDSMPRDIDENGHPWQLIGSAVLEKVHHKQFSLNGSYCIFLMTDGAGNFLTERSFSRILNLINNEKPNPADLDYLSSDLVFEARSNGSSDDISIIILFIDL